MHSEGYSSLFLCVCLCVCLSVTTLAKASQFYAKKEIHTALVEAFLHFKLMDFRKKQVMV